LKVDKNLLTASNGGWGGNGSMHVASGTRFLVAPEFDQWQGYVLSSDGSAYKIDAGFGHGLAKDVDFSSDCATDAALHDFTQTRDVVLASPKLYAKQDLSGDACTLDAGTTMTNFSYDSAGSGPVSVSSNEIQAKCGLGIAYATVFEYASLIPTP
jgi:hypothetical protein